MPLTHGQAAVAKGRGADQVTTLQRYAALHAFDLALGTNVWMC